MRRFPARPLAPLLMLAWLLSCTAQALTTDQARELLETYYIDPVPQQVLEQENISDMLDALGDPYTQYFTPEEYAAFLASMLDTTQVGIGIVAQNAGTGLILTSVIAGSPAETAGLRAGDVITAIDGQSTLGVGTEIISTWIAGEEGSSLTVTYEREGSSCTVTLTRAVITIPAASTQLQQGHIGFVECSTFGADTTTHLTQDVKTLAGQADHWIIDLRGNGGGMVSDAITSAALFTGPGVLGYLRDAAGQYGALGTQNAALTLYPAIVLTDGQTASAAELFASAIRDGGAGIAVGGRTYGKGVAQSIFDQTNLPEYFADGDGMKITSQRFFAANGAATDTVGVIPHLLVEPEQAEGVARLLSDTGPKGDTTGFLRIDFVWRWYVRLDTALSPENLEAFAALLEALPASVRVWEGAGGPDGWSAITGDEVAERYGISLEERGFSDTADSPYTRQIDLLATYRLLEGDGTGAFHPEDSLTRAQLCALLAQALGCQPYTGQSRFSDVDEGEWYCSAVNSVAALGLVDGVGGSRFNPDGLVDHQQLITILARTAQRLNLYFYESGKNRPGEALADQQLLTYADWARESVWLLGLSQRNLLGGTVNLLWDDVDAILPAAEATREEAAALVYTVLSYAGVLPV